MKATIATKGLNVAVLPLAFAVVLTTGLVGYSSQGEISSKQARKSTRHILFLFSDNVRTPWGLEQDRVLRQRLASLKQPIEIFTENLDNIRTGEGGYDKLQADFFHEKYKNIHFDVIIAIKPAALKFLLDHRADAFGNTPMVFSDVGTHEKVLEEVGTSVPGALMDYDLRPSLDLIQKIQPDTKHVVIVFGASALEADLLDLASSQIASYTTKLTTEYWVGLAPTELRTKLATLPLHTAVLYVSEFKDRTGRYFAPSDVIAEFADASSVPVYSLVYTYLGMGTVGGRLVNATTDAKIAADLALQILNGERPEALKSVVEPATLAFDSRVLRRYGIPESRLPPGSLVLFRETSVWTRYKAWIIGAAGIIALQILLISVLIVHRNRRIEAETALDYRLRLETLISEISAGFVEIPIEEIGPKVELGLERLREFLQVDRATMRFRDDKSDMQRAYSTRGDNVPAGLSEIKLQKYPWTAKKLSRAEAVLVSQMRDVPREGEADRRLWLQGGIKSIAIIPVVASGVLLASLHLITLKDERIWSVDIGNQLLVIAEVFFNALRRKQVAEVLQESEERFRSALEHSAMGMALVDADGRWLRVNPALCEIFGYSEKELLAMTFQALTHPDDLEANLSYKKQLFGGQIRHFHMEKRYIHKQGHSIWAQLTASAVQDGSGKVVYGIAQIQDITARKESEAALQQNQKELQSLAGRLITIQEDERKRIARELHDDLSQRLALHCVDLDLLRKNLSAESEIGFRLERLRSEAETFVTDIRQISHDQHHPQLALGLEHGISSFCREFYKRCQIGVELTYEGDLRQVPENLSLVVFRVLQEALGNVAKHSGAIRATAVVNVKEDQVLLRVTDWGRGFAAERIQNGNGLGLISMRERLRLVGGTMTVRSAPGKGTNVEAVVPLMTSETARLAFV